MPNGGFIFMCRYLQSVTMSSIPHRAWSARRCGRRNGSRFTRHLEIETYTWDVLPATLKIDVSESITREYRWVLETLKLDAQDSRP